MSAERYLANEDPEVWVVFANPPHLQQLKDAGMSPSPNAIFAYGNEIYAPNSEELPPHIVEHELVHCKRQIEMGVDVWWDRYVREPYFRIDEEVLAYAKQYRYACTVVKDRNERFGFLHRLAADLSGPTYGNVITQQGAMNRIKEAAGGGK